MGLTVTQRPNQNNAFVCTGNPIIYKMTRKDYATNSISNSGGFALVKVTGDITGLLTLGDQIYLELDNAEIANTGTITAESFAAGETSITTSIAYGAGTTGWINLLTYRSRYRVEVELYRQTDNTLIFSFLEYAPTPNGRVTIDVSMPLNEYITSEPLASPNYGIPYAISGPQSFRKLWRNTTPGSLGFYIKYREVWTGSAQAQTSDSANPSWAAKGARQIGELYGGYLKEYSETTGRKFLTKFTAPKIWPGRIMALSIIEPTNPPSSTNRLHIKREYYTPSGVLDFALYELPGLTGADIAGIYDHAGSPVDISDPSSTPQYLIYDKQFNAGTSWVNLGNATSYPTVTLGPGTSSKDYAIPVLLKSGRSYNFAVTWEVSAGAGAETMTLRARVIRLDQVTAEATFTSAARSQGFSGTEIFTLTPAADTYWLFIDLSCSAGVNNRTGLIAYPAVIYTLPRWIDFSAVTRDDTAKTETTGISETLRHHIVPLPTHDNQVQLLWKNSLGGASTWVFDFSQEYSYKFDTGKRKRMVLFAQHLTANEWEAINELNAIGDVYRVPHNELTTSVNKSHARKGSQVYLVDSGGKQTGVVVIPTEVRTRTRNEQHSIELTIELPEIQAPR